MDTGQASGPLNRPPIPSHLCDLQKPIIPGRGGLKEQFLWSPQSGWGGGGEEIYHPGSVQFRKGLKRGPTNDS